LPPPPWEAGLSLAEDGLGLDSLECMEVASALSEALHLHESGVEDLLLARRTFGEWIDLASRGLSHFDARLTFRTSGSSGEPKRCVHPLGDLAQEVDHLADLFRGTKRVLAAVPSYHIYGFLLTVLLPERLDNIEVIDVRLMTPQALTRQLKSGDLVVSHPAHWALVARLGGAMPTGVTGVSSTAPCPAELAAELTRAGGGLARLVQIYGSSETAGVGWRETSIEPFQLMPYWRRAVTGEFDLLRQCDDGETRSTSTQDVIEWQDDRHFRVGERLDAAVQVCGINVFPNRVRTMLLTHPLVCEASVRLMRVEEGQRLKAFVVPKVAIVPGTLRSELEQWANQHLSAPERPKSYTIGDRIPVNENGKTCDWS
jgi:long-chain acyl-CoA synthetase